MIISYFYKMNFKFNLTARDPYLIRGNTF